MWRWDGIKAQTSSNLTVSDSISTSGRRHVDVSLEKTLKPHTAPDMFCLAAAQQQFPQAH